MKTDFKVYPRRIDVYVRQNSNMPGSALASGLIYMHSTNAFRTCRDAVSDARTLHPHFDFVANFGK